MEIANQEVELLLDTLTPKEKQAVILRVYDDKTFKEIGAEISLSKDRANQVYKKAIRKLRHPRRLKYLSYIGLDHTYEFKEDPNFEGENFIKWFEDYFNNPPDKYKIKAKPRKKITAEERKKRLYSYYGRKPKEKYPAHYGIPGIPFDAPSVGIVYRGFKKEVLPGVFMYADQT